MVQQWIALCIAELALIIGGGGGALEGAAAVTVPVVLAFPGCVASAAGVLDWVASFGLVGGAGFGDGGEAGNAEAELAVRIGRAPDGA